MSNNMHGNTPGDDPDDGAATFLPVILGTVLLGVAAVGFSFIFRTPLAPQISTNVNDLLVGVIATLPLVVFLWWISNTTHAQISAFRRSQIKFFAEIGFDFTPPRIAMMAIGAGISEELLFRGVLQTWIDGFSPLMVAIVASNILFGMLHIRTVLYAAIAGCIGIYLGVLYSITGNLLTVIVTHALYDAIALEYTRRAILAWRNSR